MAFAATSSPILSGGAGSYPLYSSAQQRISACTCSDVRVIKDGRGSGVRLTMTIPSPRGVMGSVIFDGIMMTNGWSSVPDNNMKMKKKKNGSQRLSLVTRSCSSMVPATLEPSFSDNERNSNDNVVAHKPRRIALFVEPSPFA